jgi:restriction endonuclease S subunit
MQRWVKSTTNLFALRGSEVASNHRKLQSLGNRSFVRGDFGNRSEGFPAFGNEGGTWSSSNASITGGGSGGGGGVGFITVNNKTVSSISGNVTTSPDGDVFYFPGTNFSIGDGFALQLRTSLRQRRWRKQRRKQWQREERQQQWQRPQQ